MARLPSFRRLYEQDFPQESQDLIRQLSVSINYGFEPLYEVLNGKLTFTENTASLITTVNVQVDSNGKPTNKTTIKKNSSEKFQGFQVIKAVNLTSSNVFPSSAPFLTYTETTDQIVIDHVSGIPANNLFQLTVFGIR